MPQVIIYRQNNGVMAIVYPSPEAIAQIGIRAVAVKDVPAGKPFKIINAVEVPTDREARMAWSVDDTELSDGVGGGLE